MLLERLKGFSVEEQSNDFFFFCHLLLAAFFFSPFFLFGQILICSTDVLNANFPWLVFAKHNFELGSLGLWNPFIMSGTSLFSCSLGQIFSPDNWPHFVFPERYFFQVGTFLSFVKLWLIGVFSYLLFYEELKSRKWAFFSSATYQLSGYTIWAVLVYDTLSLLLFFTIALYLIWAMHKRGVYLTYVYMTLILVMVFLSSNIAYGAYATITIFVLCFYRTFSLYQLTPDRLKVFFICSLSLLMAIFLTLFHFLPIWMELQDINRIPPSFSADFKDSSFLALRLFNPEILGICYRSSLGIIAKMSPPHEGFHIQWAMPQFFGVLPALLVLLAIVSPKRGRADFWVFYVIITLSLILFIEPFDTIFRVLMFPVYHTLSMQIFVPVGFCMLAGYAAKYLEEEGAEGFSVKDKSFRFLIFLIISIFLYMLAVWVTNHPGHIRSIKLSMALLLALAMLAFFMHSRWEGLTTLVSPYLGILGLAGLFLYMLLVDHRHKTYLSHLKNILASLVMLISIYLSAWMLTTDRIKRGLCYLAVPLFVACFSVVLYPWAVGVRDLPSKHQDLVLAALGTVRFIVVVAIFLTVLGSLSKKRFKPVWLFPFFFLVLISEQLPAGKIHSHLVINPFYRASTPYPGGRSCFVGEDRRPIVLDTENYRVNFPNSLLQLPVYKELYGSSEVLSSAYSIYGIRSYGGHTTGVAKRYERFVRTLAPAKEAEIGYGVYTKVKDDRFLDLCGVGYAYENDSGFVKVRPNALSRVMLFKSYEIISDDGKALERLKEPGFVPLKTLILDRDPGLPNQNPTNPAEKLQIVHWTADSVEVQVNTASPALLFFNDSYHEDWKAYVNGREHPILIADHNFMATAVPAGESRVVFRFQPRFFYYGVYLSSIGLFIFLSTGVALYFSGKRFMVRSEPG